MVTIHEKNWRLTSIVTKQKINFVVVERIKQTRVNQLVPLSWCK